MEMKGRHGSSFLNSYYHEKNNNYFIMGWSFY